MRALNLEVGQVSFCHEAAKLQCQATTRVFLTTDAACHEEVSIDANTLSCLDLCYRVSQPFYFLIDLCSGDDIHWDPEEHAVVREALVERLSSAQFWLQLRFGVVGADLPLNENTQQPFNIHVRLGLELVESTSSAQGKSQILGLNVNDLNYPRCLPQAQIKQISFSLRLARYAREATKPRTATSGQRPVANGGANFVNVGQDSVLAFVDATLRSSICSSKPRLAAGLKFKGDTSPHTLQSLFPAVFSPTGFQYIADRSSFISCISKSLSGYFNTNSVEGESPQELTRSSRVQHYNQQIQPEGAQNGDCDDVEALLWSYLMKNARNSQRNVTLKPLSGLEQPSATISTMLSERLTKSTSTHLPNQSQHCRVPDSNDDLLDYSCSGIHGETDLAYWSEDDDLFDGGFNKHTARNDNIVPLQRTSFQTNQFDEPNEQDVLYDQDDEMLGISYLRGLKADVAFSHTLDILEDDVTSASRQFDRRSGSSLLHERAVFSPADTAYEESQPQSCIDLIGPAGSLRELSKKDTRISGPQKSFTNWEYGTRQVQDPQTECIIDDNPVSDILSLQKSYILQQTSARRCKPFSQLEGHSISARLPQAILNDTSHLPTGSLASSSSDAHLFLTTTHSSQDSMPSFQDLHRLAKVTTPAKEPTLEELLGDDKGLWDLWQRRGSIGLQSGSLHSMYESDPDMKVFGGGHWKRSSSNESMGEGTIQRPASAYTKAPATQSSPSSPRNTLSKRSSMSSSSTSSSPTSEKKPNLLRRLSKSSKASSNHEMLDFDFSRIQQDRDIEVKRRKTLDDYDDDDDMLFN